MPVAGTDVEYILASTYPPKNVQKVNVQWVWWPWCWTVPHSPSFWKRCIKELTNNNPQCGGAPSCWRTTHGDFSSWNKIHWAFSFIDAILIQMIAALPRSSTSCATVQ
jgi:hypothetical protein